MTTPAPGATGVPLTQAITATFSAPYNPDSLTPTSFVVCGADCNTMVAGSITQPSANTLVFTPAVALPANSTINVYVGYYYYSSTIYDLAGDVFSGLSLHSPLPQPSTTPPRRSPA